MESYDELTRLLGDDIIDSSDPNLWSIFADWVDGDAILNGDQPRSELVKQDDFKTPTHPKMEFKGSYSCIPDHRGKYTLTPDALTPTIPSCSVSPQMPGYCKTEKESEPLIFQTKYPPKRTDPHFKMEADMFPLTRYPPSHPAPPPSHSHVQPQVQFTNYCPEYYQTQQTIQNAQAPSAQPPKWQQQNAPNVSYDFNFVPSQTFYGMSYSSGSNGEGGKVQIQPLPNQYNVPLAEAPSRVPMNLSYLPQHRNGNEYTRNYDFYYPRSSHAHQLKTTHSPRKTIAKPSIINSKGKRKTDHELREEFYRREFRLQTNGKDPPRFSPSRSAYDESFIWRPTVNQEYGISIPVYRRINGKLDSLENCSRSGRRVRTKRDHSQTNIEIPESCKGDIAYYFKKSRYAYIHETTGEELDTGVEEFERGDVVAILGDGTVTHNTADPDVQFLSVIPGSVSDQLSPWKTLPDPAPEPIEDYQLVSLLGMVYVRVKDSHHLLQSQDVSEIRKSFVIVPDGNNNGYGKLVKKLDCTEKSDDDATCCRHVVAIPFDNNVLPHNDGYLVLCMRSGDTVRPLLDSLREKDNNSLASLQEEQQNEMDNLSKQAKQLGIDYKEHMKVHDNNDEMLSHFAEDLTQVAGADEDTAEQKKIPDKMQHVELYPRRTSSRTSTSECDALSLILSFKEANSIIQNDKGAHVAFEPYSSSYYASLIRRPLVILRGIILIDVLAENNERRTYAIQKRDCFQSTFITQLEQKKYAHSLNGIFSEIYVEDKFIMRILRVVRKTDSRWIHPIIPLAELFQWKSNPPANGVLTCLPANGDLPENSVDSSASHAEYQSFSQMMKNGQWDDVCLYLTSDRYAPALFQKLSEEELSNMKEGIDELLQKRFSHITREHKRICVLIKDDFFPCLFENEPTMQQIKRLACYYVTLLPACTKTLTLTRMSAIMVAIKNNPVMSLLWATRNNLEVLSKLIEWNWDTQQAAFPNLSIAKAVFHIYSYLLCFTCVIRKLGTQAIVVINSVLDLIRLQLDEQMTASAFSILLSISKDPFIRAKLVETPRLQELLRGHFVIDDVHQPVMQQVIKRLKQLFFTEVFVADDLQVSVPFVAKLPYPTPSGRDKIWDTLLILNFYGETRSEISFHVKIGISGLKELKDSCKKNSLQLDFLDTASNCYLPCLWSVSLVYEGELFTSSSPKRSEKDNLWHCVFSLDSPCSNRNKWEENIPHKGVYVVFHGKDISPRSWVALGALTFCK